MLSYFEAVIFGILQGVTELFPVSSLGHSIVLPRALGWDIDQTAPFFLLFLVATHAATALVLFAYFFKDWKLIIGGVLRSLRQREVRQDDHYAKLGWLLVVGTIPAGLLGLLFEETLKHLFAAPRLVAAALILNGVILYGAELLRRKQAENNSPVGSDERLGKMTWQQSIRIGVLQCLALIPGFSRTGATLTGGLLVGLSHEDAVRFSFLLATPLIGAAAVLKLPELAGESQREFLLPILVGAVTSGIAAYFSVRFLTRYFEQKKLTPFAIYCMAGGAMLSLLFLFR